MSKSKIPLLIGVLLAITVLIVGIVGNSGLFNVIIYAYQKQWSYNADYRTYASQFNTVKDYLLQEYPDATDRSLAVGYKNNAIYLYDYELKIYLDLPDTVSGALKTLSDNAFPSKDARLDLIRISDGRIDFDTNNGLYSIAYSPNGKPDSFLTKKKVDVIVRHISGGWYHVIKRLY